MIDTSDGDLARRRALGAHLDAMLALCETARCRRVQLLAYFGETAEPCGNCDTCLEPPETWDGTVAAQKLLSTVLRLQRERGQAFGAGQSVDILLGRSTPKVAQQGHDRLSTFGIGTELGEAAWRGVVRQLLAQGLLAVQGEYGVLALTEASGEVLRGERQVLLRREDPRPTSRGRRAASAAAAADLPARPRRCSSGSAHGGRPRPRSAACRRTSSSTTRPCGRWRWRSRAASPSSAGSAASGRPSWPRTARAS
jgi:ATP-dependent DNA helicase RecQ